MHVVVLGAGIIGVTTAYFLRKEGCEVTVIDRESGSALECSYANGAQLSYSHAEPWATWSNVFKGLRWMGQANAPLLLRPRWDLDMYKWLLKFLMNCPRSKVQENTFNLLRIAFYSKKILNEVMEEVKLKFHYGNKGIIHLFKTKKDLDKITKYFELLSKVSEVEFDSLDKDACLKREPSLDHMMKKMHGGIHCTLDETGDIYMFTREMEKKCKAMGVEFHYNTEVKSFGISNGKVVGVETNISHFKADKFVMCLGAYTGKYLSSIGIKVPIYPMKGYSITVPTGKSYASPHTSIYDHDYKIVYTRLGEETLRVAGTVEFAGYNHDILEERIKPIVHDAKTTFPELGDYGNIEKWACLRPQTPQSTPIISKTKYSNLVVNSGHGSLGWTQACGSAKIAADLVVGKTPEIDITGFKV